MGKVNYTPEQIVTELRKVEVLCTQGYTIVEAARQIGVSEQTYYKWRRQYGGMSTADVRRLKNWKKKMFGSKNWSQILVWIREL